MPWLRIKPFLDARKTKERFYGLVASVDDNFSILKEMFYGLVTSVDDIIGDFERDVIRCACVRR